MKNRFFLITLMAVLIWSCNDDITETVSTEIANNDELQTDDSDNIRICLFKMPSTVDSINSRLSYSYTYWKNGETIKIKFLNGNSSQQNAVKVYASEWLRYANVKFQWVSRNQYADIKIQFGNSNLFAGQSSFGKFSRLYGQYSPSMELYQVNRKTVLHEFGHALGLAHEVQNPSANIQWNKAAVYNDLGKKGWPRYMVDGQIFNVANRYTTDHSYYDKFSIMMYAIPHRWTTNGYSVRANTTLSARDIQQIGLIYPFSKYNVRPFALYRYWNGSIGDHFYTNNWYERGLGTNGYKYEGFIGYLSPTKQNGTVPFYRFYNSRERNHFYNTQLYPQGDNFYGWTLEGPMGYIYTTAGPGRKPLYRYYHAGYGDHFYTTNYNELKGGKNGYRYEKVVGYLIN